MAPTLDRNKGTKKTAASARTAATPKFAMIKCMINGETVINGEFPWGMGTKLQKAWGTIQSTAKSTRAAKGNKAAVRGSSTTPTRSRNG